MLTDGCHLQIFADFSIKPDPVPVPWEYEGQVEDSGVSLEFLRHLIVQQDGRFSNELWQANYYNTLAVLYRRITINNFDIAHEEISKQIIRTIRTCKTKRLVMTAALYAFYAISKAIRDLTIDSKLLSSCKEHVLSAMDDFGDHCGVQVAGMHALCAVVTRMAPVHEHRDMEASKWIQAILQAAKRHHTCERVRVWSLHTIYQLMSFLDTRQADTGYQVIDCTMHYLQAYNHHIPTISYVWHVVKLCLAMSKNMCLYFADADGPTYLSVATSSLRYDWVIQMTCFHVLAALADASVSYPRLEMPWTSLFFNVIATMQHYSGDTELIALGVKLCRSALVARSCLDGLEFVSNRVVNVLLQAMAVLPHCFDTHTQAMKVLISVCRQCKEALGHLVSSGGVSRVLRSAGQFPGNVCLRQTAHSILVMIFQDQDALIPAENAIEIGLHIISLDMENLRTSLEILEALHENVVSRADFMHVENGVHILADFIQKHCQSVDAQHIVCRLLKSSWQAQGEVSRKFKENPLIENCLSFVVGNSKFPDNVRQLACELLACLVENRGKYLPHLEREYCREFLRGDRPVKEFRSPSFYRLRRSARFPGRQNFNLKTMVQNVVAAMHQVETYQHSVNLNGCEILRSLCSTETANVIQHAVIETNGIEAILRAMDNHHTDLNLFLVGEDALCCVCANATILQVLLNKGCARVMKKKRCLSRSHDDELLQTPEPVLSRLY